MQGIEILNGAIFMSDGKFTLRYSGGKWAPSPIDFDVLLWEKEKDDPNGYEYIFEDDIKNMGEECYSQMIDEFKKIYLALRLECPW